MKRYFSLSLFLLLGPMAVSTSSCTEECGLALADLVTDVVITGVQTIAAGTPFGIPNIIQNIPNTVASCQGDIQQTFSAGQSQSRIQIDYDENQNGSFNENEVNSRFDVPGIPPGMQAEQDYTFSFNEPGDYRVITLADDAEDIDERNENNNVSDPESISSGLPTPGGSGIEEVLIVRVLPNPNYTRPPGTPQVELLDYSVVLSR